MPKPSYLSNQLVKYLYKEMPEQEKEEFVPQVFEQEELHAEFSELLTMKEQLDQLRPEPSKRCIDAILDFAKQ